MRPPPIQRLRMSRLRLESLAGDLDLEEAVFAGGRSSIRRPCCRPGVLATGEDSLRETRHEVFVRNVSESGSSVLHMVFLPTYAPCKLVLIAGDREPITVGASVVRCRHIEGPMHELGLRFTRPLTAGQAERLCLSPHAVIRNAGDEADRMREALHRCTELTEQVRRLIQDSAGAEEVLPLLDELGSLESLTRRAA